MLIVGINGSPRKGGSSAFLLSRIMNQVSTMGARTAVLQAQDVLASQTVAYCTACSAPCNGMCYSNTPLANAFQLMAQADGLVLASPVYFGTVSAQLKALFDKSRRLRQEKGLYNTVGCGIAVGAARFGGQETTLRAIHDIMLVHGMIIVGDGYAGADCGHHGVAAQRPAEEDASALQRIDLMARRLMEVCHSTISLRQVAADGNE